MTKEQELDLIDITNVLSYCAQGWSVSVACRKAGVMEKKFRALKQIYPEFKEKLKEYYKRGVTTW